MRYKRPFSIILFDIDQFKAVNDTFGHFEGDKVLKELSKLVASLMRKTDFVGRWGGGGIFTRSARNRQCDAAQAC